MNNDGCVVTKGGFKFKRPGNSLSLSKPKPPGSIISSEVQKNVPKPVSAGIAQNRHNATSSFNSNFGRTENKGGNNPAPRPVNYGVTLNKNDNNRQGSGPGPISFGMPSSKDEDITFVSQTKPLRELSNVHEGGQRKMIEKDKKPSSTFQTSITAFTMQNKARPVAAVAPHRSPLKPDSDRPVTGGKRKSDELVNNWSMKNLSDMFRSFDDGDNDSDFDMDMPTGSPSFKKTLTQSIKKKEEELPVDSAEEDDDDIISYRPKRRRTLELMDSDDENDTLEDNGYTEHESFRQPAIEVKQDTQEKQEKKDVYDLQVKLLKATDQVCDLLMQLSNADLMALLKKNYTTIQNLLLARNNITEEAKGVNLLHHVKITPQTPGDSLPDLPGNLKEETSSAGQVPKPTVKTHLFKKRTAIKSEDQNIDTKPITPIAHPIRDQTIATKALPLTSTVSKNPAGRLADTSRNFGSPIPCGDSFFEDDAVLTQTHKDFMSKFKRVSLPGSNNSGNSNFSSPTVNFTSPIIKGQNAYQQSPDQTLNPSVMYGQKKSTVLKQSNSFISPNRYKPNHATGKGNSHFDNIDDEMNLELAEQSDFDFDYKISSAALPAAKKSIEKGDNFSSNSLHKGDNYGGMGGNYDLDQSGQDMFSIDDFGDEDFAEVLDYDDNLPAISHNSRASAGSTGQTSGNISRARSPSCAPQHQEFANHNFGHSEEMMKIFRKIFGLQKFRHHQLEACNAALTGEDTFILMPTGGGKSLCYQLPALVDAGVSVVISPLRALIQDQVQKLLSLRIPAGHLSSDVSQTEADLLYTKLHKRVPEIKLLYVTPEKISASGKLMSVLENLYNRNLMDRFVIDEAHCVSSWGHDFRPDYKKLSVLREKFPGVPIMALTATATMRVRKDICHQLLLKDPKWFTQSFNRPNLKMEVMAKKPSSATKDVIQIIKEKFPGKCGIVYCLSRKECDDVASNLSKAGILSVSYHAGLSDSERTMIQEKWLNGNRCKVICATIAFGMGIDKPDVRFVIHYSIPKSVEGYYQEAGRAGRDGLLSACILLYTYADVKRWRRIIEMDKSATYDSKRVHIDNLFRMIQYCENVYDCRRAQLLHYFGEHKFDRAKCSQFRGAICDNCVSKETFKLRDVTEDAKLIIKCVRDLTSGRKADYTLIHFIEIFKGSKNKNIVDKGHDKNALHGRGTAYSRSDAERLFRKLVIDGVLYEELKITAMDTTACYIKLGRRANDVLNGKLKVELQVQENRKKSEVQIGQEPVELQVQENRKKSEVQIGQEPITKKQTLIEECYNELVEMAKTISSESGVFNWSTVFRTTTLGQMAEMTPTSLEELRKIEGVTNTNIARLGDDRMLEITAKYAAMFASLEDTVVEAEDSEPEEWSSHYFPGPSSSGSGRGGKRGGSKKKYAPRKKRAAPKTGGRKKASGNTNSTASRSNASSGWMSKSNNLSQYKYGSSGGSKPSSMPRSGGAARGGGAMRTVSGSGPGMMPVPQPRSFLTGGGHYF